MNRITTPGDTCCKDCAGAILYSTEKAVEVALEAMQCLGGNGYINGEKDLQVHRQILTGNFRLSHG
jgi:alkylation response protein AidB-like acyl-CoA dehydrogenase